MLPFPAYGNALWQRRLAGERVRIVGLVVGDDWRRPRELFPTTPLLAVRAWHDSRPPRFDWRLVAETIVLAYDRRNPGERPEGPGGADSWLWLLADAQRYARAVLIISPAHPFDADEPEAWLDVFAFVSSTLEPDAAGGWRRTWPAWWPYAERMFDGAAAA